MSGHVIGTRVVIYPNRNSTSPLIWEALAHLAEIQFEDFDSAQCWRDAAAGVFLQPNGIELRNATRAGIPTFVFNPDGSLTEPPRQGRIAFGNSACLDPRIRNRLVSHGGVECTNALRCLSGDEILAKWDGIPVWTRRPGEREGGFTEFSSVPLPVIPAGRHPLDFLNGGDFMRLLPLLHFLRGIAGNAGWTPPAAKACLVIDDANLHWGSYGFIAFEELLRRAKGERCHVSFATVPLDGWYAQAATARLFRENSAFLSLLVHGNNHTTDELAGLGVEEERLKTLAQSLARISSLERRIGFGVARVMVPPHEACCEALMPALQALGFEGACISSQSLRDWSPNRHWPAAFGLEASTRMDAGFHAISRFGLSGNWRGQILISAFLGQPIIPSGHHNTFAGGLELLDELAAEVNSIPLVTWEDPGTILRSLYSTSIVGELLRLRPHSSRIRLRVPNGVRSVMVDSAAASDPRSSYWLFGANSSSRRPRPPRRIQAGEPCEVSGGECLELRAAQWGVIDFRRLKTVRTSPWALIRRLACETRDRCMPLLPGAGFPNH